MVVILRYISVIVLCIFVSLNMFVFISIFFIYFCLQGPIGLDGPRGYPVSLLHNNNNNFSRICDLLVIKCRDSHLAKAALTSQCNVLLL